MPEILGHAGRTGPPALRTQPLPDVPSSSPASLILHTSAISCSIESIGQRRRRALKPRIGGSPADIESA
ncbi:hypothetical protein CP533_0558 [Ophiocordyceps camponoti-saundersi (nom. inval.)]|nr:hypothetical protein CP533_0558 [Ophiocordyceps camponoti-saundersi (nom. inval.)]